MIKTLAAPHDGTRGLFAAAVALAAMVFIFPLTLGLPLIDPDEGLHAHVAQEMVERGDWVTPKSLGEPFLDKPILFTWAQALSLGLFGMNEAAVRLPGLLFGLLAMVTTGIVGWRMFGRKVGLVAAMLYATTILPVALTQVPVHDVALVPWVSLAILLFWEADRAVTRRGRAGCVAAVGVLLGLSCLAKGLAGVALVGVAYGSYLLISRRLTVAVCIRGAVALAVAGVVGSAWYLAIEVRNPGYLYYYFVERHVLGYATSTQKHGAEPWWYYLPILLFGGMPWIAYLPVGLRDWWAGRNQPQRGTIDPAVLLLLCWLFGSTLFLSMAGSKLVTYIWPVFPAVAILVALVWIRLLEGALSEPARRWFTRNFWSAGLCGPVALPIVLAVAGRELDIRFSWAQWTATLLAAITPWVALAWWRAGRLHGALLAGIGSTVVQFVAVLVVVGPYAARVNTARDLAQYFNALGEVPSRVIIVEDRVGSVIFYLDPPLRAGLVAGQFEPIRAKRLGEMPEPPSDGLIAMAQRRFRRAGRYYHLDEIEFERTGRYRLYTPTQWKAIRTAAVSVGGVPVRR